MISQEEYIKAKQIVNQYEKQLTQLTPAPKGKWKCMICGRDKFTHKSPHKCIGGYRKRKIIWQEI